MIRRIHQIGVTEKSLRYWNQTTECSPEHPHFHTACCLDMSEEVARIALSLYLSESCVARYLKSGRSCLTAESLLAGENTSRHYILAITIVKWKAKAGIAE